MSKTEKVENAAKSGKSQSTELLTVPPFMEGSLFKTSKTLNSNFFTFNGRLYKFVIVLAIVCGAPQAHDLSRTVIFCKHSLQFHHLFLQMKQVIFFSDVPYM